ncbi:hypothetical protein QBC33DRAFT_557508 [Phialemonium atrogriseum]|uniref:Uncharacterized protein n=1 Tax=Phialemonium atrogriseum TaxID=1093897 RepID=A0AAJ0C6T2_9PEZI|nr:uncharacterized protein QBC33DRAFT_557508 [Phialemonium atrogriseum]KAK1768726.1 hypothetical protein QBC33DRAFT_557508 [Phialemonium atrogriseum]
MPMTSSPVSDDNAENDSDHSSYDSSAISVDGDSDGDSEDSDFAPDELGIYTGPETDAVLAQSHAHWHNALRAAQSARPGQFPDNAFDLKGLLLCVPALPDSIRAT